MNNEEYVGIISGEGVGEVRGGNDGGLMEGEEWGEMRIVEYL